MPGDNEQFTLYGSVPPGSANYPAPVAPTLPDYPPAAEPAPRLTPIWSVGRTVAAVVAAVVISILGAVAVSAVDNGPSSSNTGGFRIPGNSQFGNGQFGNGQFGNGQFGNGQFGNGQFGNGQFGAGPAGAGAGAGAGAAGGAQR